MLQRQCSKKARGRWKEVVGAEAGVQEMRFFMKTQYWQRNTVQLALCWTHETSQKEA